MQRSHLRAITGDRHPHPTIDTVAELVRSRADEVIIIDHAPNFSFRVRRDRLTLSIEGTPDDVALQHGSRRAVRDVTSDDDPNLGLILTSVAARSALVRPLSQPQAGLSSGQISSRWHDGLLAEHITPAIAPRVPGGRYTRVAATGKRRVPLPVARAIAAAADGVRPLATHRRRTGSESAFRLPTGPAVRLTAGDQTTWVLAVDGVAWRVDDATAPLAVRWLHAAVVVTSARRRDVATADLVSVA